MGSNDKRVSRNWVVDAFVVGHAKGRRCVMMEHSTPYSVIRSRTPWRPYPTNVNPGNLEPAQHHADVTTGNRNMDCRPVKNMSELSYGNIYSQHANPGDSIGVDCVIGKIEAYGLDEK